MVFLLGMKRFNVAFICILVFTVSHGVFAQVRYTKLVVAQNQFFELKASDILVVDTLVMEDSSRIVLNKLKKENYIRTKVIIIGNHCTIDGSGVHGSAGRPARIVNTTVGPCQKGVDGKPGGRGLDGSAAVSLFLYVENISIKGRLYINLTGGNGGQGGRGGDGGYGGQGTLYCAGGDGGNGGIGGRGGNGGDGGIIWVDCQQCPLDYSSIGKTLIINCRGGYNGIGGIGGAAGNPGLSPSRSKGLPGKVGEDGPNGTVGKNGGLNFQLN
jgi:hypothetical protein